MTAENFTNLVNNLRDRKPFRPFTIRLNDGSHIEVDHPGAIAAAEGAAVGWAPGRIPFWIEADAVSLVEGDLATRAGQSTAPAA